MTRHMGPPNGKFQQMVVSAMRSAHPSLVERKMKKKYSEKRIVWTQDDENDDVEDVFNKKNNNDHDDFDYNIDQYNSNYQYQPCNSYGYIQWCSVSNIFRKFGQKKRFRPNSADFPCFNFFNIFYRFRPKNNLNYFGLKIFFQKTKI
jgi:hypothetical protein